MELHELESAALARQVAEMEGASSEQRAQLESLLEAKQQEAALLRQLMERSDEMDMTKYVSRAALTEEIAAASIARQEEAQEIWKELEATTDVFMPKSKINAMFNAHEAQLAELRRLIPKAEQGEQKRVWNDDLQMFEDVSVPTSVARTAANSGLPTQLEALQATFQVAPNQPRTRMDLELELAATRREYQDLQNEIGELMELRDQLALAEAEVVSAHNSPTTSKPGSQSGSSASLGNLPRRLSQRALDAALDSAALKLANGGRAESAAAATAGSGSRAVDALDKSMSSMSMGRSRSDGAAAAAAADDEDKTMPPKTKSGLHLHVTAEAGRKASMAMQSPKAAAAAAAAAAEAEQTKDELKGKTLRHTPKKTNSLMRRRSFGVAEPGTSQPTLETEETLAGEEWMFDPKIQQMLHIKNAARAKVAQLRQESHTKVMQLRLSQKNRPHQMTFSEKMAYFTTARVGIHEDIARRVLQAEGELDDHETIEDTNRATTGPILASSDLRMRESSSSSSSYRPRAADLRFSNLPATSEV